MLEMEIEEEEQKKLQIQADIQILTKRMVSINATLAKKVRSRNGAPFSGQRDGRSRREMDMPRLCAKPKLPMLRSSNLLKRCYLCSSAKRHRSRTNDNRPKCLS